MTYFVYILTSLKDSKRYIGMTSDLSRRLNEHNSGKVKSTKNRRPLELIYTEEFISKQDALNRETFFKSGIGREFLKSIGCSILTIVDFYYHFWVNLFQDYMGPKSKCREGLALQALFLILITSYYELMKNSTGLNFINI